MENPNSSTDALVKKAEELTISFEFQHISEAGEYVETQTDSMNLWDGIRQQLFTQSNEPVDPAMARRYQQMIKTKNWSCVNDLTSYAHKLLSYEETLSSSVENSEIFGKQLLETFAVQYRQADGGKQFFEVNYQMSQRLGLQTRK